MAAITLNVPDEHIGRVVDALCAAGGWRSLALDGPRPAFAKKALVDYVRSVTVGYESDKVRAVAMAQIVEPSPPTIT